MVLTIRYLFISWVVIYFWQVQQTVMANLRVGLFSIHNKEFPNACGCYVNKKLCLFNLFCRNFDDFGLIIWGKL